MTPTTRCWSGPCPARRAWSAATCCRPTAASSSPQGKALSSSAKRDVKVLVVGNPANTNALIAQRNAPDLDPGRFTAMTRLDHNRAVTQLAQKLGAPVTDVTKMTIWGNHSTTQYPDLFHAEVGGKSAFELVGDHAWVDGTFIPTVAKRGAAIIEARARRRRRPRRTRPSTTCARGRSARPTATGCRWPSRPTAATACRRASSRASRAPARRRVRDRPGPRHRRLSGARSMPQWPSWSTSARRSRS